MESEKIRRKEDPGSPMSFVVHEPVTVSWAMCERQVFTTSSVNGHNYRYHTRRGSASLFFRVSDSVRFFSILIHVSGMSSLGLR
jgi:hypothetical protein